jgi:predicted DNA-binding transcriptional regulator AlpA
MPRANEAQRIANDPLVRRQEILRVLPVAYPTLARMIAAGQFPSPAMFVGHIRYWRFSDIAKWQKGRRSGWRPA